MELGFIKSDNKLICQDHQNYFMPKQGKYSGEIYYSFNTERIYPWGIYDYEIADSTRDTTVMENEDNENI